MVSMATIGATQDSALLIRAISHDNIFEPVRLIPGSDLPKPKKFYRTWWRGIVLRAIGSKELKLSTTVFRARESI